MSVPSRQDHHNQLASQPYLTHSHPYHNSNNFFPLPSYSPHPHATPSSLIHDIKMENSQNNIFYQRNLPQVGQTRCYWALLDAHLQFVVLDPVLHYHLQEQAPLILSKTLLDFVHPDEQASARNDLKGALKDEALHGSVTRVRYSRLSRVRRLLGYEPNTSSPPYPPNFPAERISIDENYMAVDIVINWVSEGLVLCFIHAVVDILPKEDNDELRKTGWSNWCSTYGFDEDQAHSTYQRLYEALPTPIQPLNSRRSSSITQSAPPSLRVFQILRNTVDRSLLLSWPTDASLQHHHPAAPTAQELARSALQVQIEPSVGNGSQAKTSCTRRFKSSLTLVTQQNQMSGAADGNGGGGKHLQVESVYIPHGTIIFACHKIDGIYSPPPLENEGVMPHNQHHTQAHTQSHSQDMGYPTYRSSDSPYQDQYLYHPSSSSHHQQPTSAGTQGTPQPAMTTTQAYVHEWVAGQSQEVQYGAQQQQQQQHAQWNPSETPSPRTGTGSAPHSRTGSGSTGSMFHHQQAQHWPHPSHSHSHSHSTPSTAAYADPSGFARTHSPAISSIADVYGSMGATASASPSASPVVPTGTVPDVVPVPGSGSTEGGSPVSLTDGHRSLPGPGISHSHTHHVIGHGHGRRSPATSTREQYSGSGRSAGNPPVGISKCSSCKATHSPEWRKGPSGKKDLCNACGLRYARSRAKKEGITAKKRKEKSTLPPRTPPVVAPVGGASEITSDAGACPTHVQLPPPRNDYEDQRSHGPSTGYGMSASQSSPLAHGGRNRGPVSYDTPSPSPPSSANTQSSFAYANNTRTYDPGSATSQSFTQAGAGAYYNLTHQQQGSLQNHTSQSSAQPYYPSQVDVGSVGSNVTTHVRTDTNSSFDNRFMPMHVTSSYERDRTVGGRRDSKDYGRIRDREIQPVAIPPIPLSADMRYGSSRSVMSVEGETENRRDRNRTGVPW